MRSLIASVVAVCAVGTANAALIPNFASTAPVGANTQFNYNLSFATDSAGTERIESGDFVTIYDIAGFVSASAGAANFTVSIQNSGVNAFGTAPTDNPALPNVTFTYTGPAVNVDATFSPFSIVSSLGAQGNGLFTSETTRNSGGPLGTPIGAIGSTIVPVPEPTSGLVLLGVGAMGLGISRRRR
ncbi:PEP-CTERM sorting domain-containing protein [Fontivita pretiosa]|uniref:PEP-CTERM sorting domain-containing protein n=1 Tax=Fontivita pretiosa TaxID=2989684 RepID=UPI003D177D7D